LAELYVKSVYFIILVEEGVKFMKYLKGGSSNKRVSTSAVEWVMSPKTVQSFALRDDSYNTLCTRIKLDTDDENSVFLRKMVSYTNFLITHFRAKEYEQDIKHRHGNELIFFFILDELINKLSVG
jgi:hypothetical protein